MTNITYQVFDISRYVNINSLMYQTPLICKIGSIQLMRLYVSFILLTSSSNKRNNNQRGERYRWRDIMLEKNERKTERKRQLTSSKT